MKTNIIFFGNGPLADVALSVLSQHFTILFHARTKEDLTTVKNIKAKNPEAIGVLASFGVIIKKDVLDLFEPVGILNIHPSLLPKYRGASPIESAIINGDTDFSVSVMKLVPAMDAGPVYYQTTLKDLPIDKTAIYEALATAGAEWIVQNIYTLPTPVKQDDSQATFTTKFDKSSSTLNPLNKTAEKVFRQIVAYQYFPKPKYTFFGLECIILKAHVADTAETDLSICCSDGKYVIVDQLQPMSRKPMDSKSFLNGYKK